LRSLLWLLLSGALWLGLVQVAPHFGVPSQIISLARSGYIALFSIYLMVELRGAQFASGTRPAHLYLYLLPLVSLFLLSLFSSDFRLTPMLMGIVGCFYLCAFALINLRSEAGQIRQAGWDLLAPPLLLVVMAHPVLTLVGGVAALAYLARLLMRPVHGGSDEHLDAFVVQLPSICIAPVVLIALRDVFDGGGLIDRTHVESFGLIVNGVGAAVWTAIVLREGLPLERAAIGLWIASFAGAVIAVFLPDGVWTSAGAILIAEGFRGAMWLGTTVALAHLSRGRGFAANLAATILPLAALWLGRDHVPHAAILLVYAGFILPVPVAAWFIVRNARTSAEQAPGEVDDADLTRGVLEGKP
jgi:hypothetical protein